MNEPLRMKLTVLQSCLKAKNVFDGQFLRSPFNALRWAAKVSSVAQREPRSKLTSN